MSRRDFSLLGEAIRLNVIDSRIEELYKTVLKNVWEQTIKWDYANVPYRDRAIVFHIDEPATYGWVYGIPVYLEYGDYSV